MPEKGVVMSHEKTGQKETQENRADEVKLPASPLRARELIPEWTNAWRWQVLLLPRFHTAGSHRREGVFTKRITEAGAWDNTQSTWKYLDMLWEETGFCLGPPVSESAQIPDSTLGRPQLSFHSKKLPWDRGVEWLLPAGWGVPAPCSESLFPAGPVTIAALSTINMIGWTWLDSLNQSLASLWVTLLLLHLQRRLKGTELENGLKARILLTQTILNPYSWTMRKLLTKLKEKRY